MWKGFWKVFGAIVLLGAGMIIYTTPEEVGSHIDKWASKCNIQIPDFLKNKTFDTYILWIILIVTVFYIIFVIIPMFPWVKWYNKLKSLRINRLKALSPINNLTVKEGLRSVLGQFRTNLVCYRYSSKKIFKINYGDSSGNEYWSGWFDLPVINMINFVDLLTIHKINELADIGKRKSYILDLNKTMMKYYEVNSEQKKMRVILRDAAQGKISFFRSGQDILSNMKNDDLGEKYKLFPDIRKSFTEVKLNPLEALDWFIKTSTYSDLIPQSLYNWRNKQLLK
jgi:hypothetical protein